MAFAEQEFSLSEKQKDGNSLRDHLEAVWKQTKKKPKELDNLIELPICMTEYWQWFLKLNARRPSGMGISAIPYSEMLAFFQLTGVCPDPCDVEVIEMFDRVALGVFAEQQDKEQKAKAKK